MDALKIFCYYGKEPKFRVLQKEQYITKLDKLLNAYENNELHNEDLFFAVYNKLKFINVIDLKQLSFYDIHSDYTSTVYYANNVKNEFDVYIKLFPY